MPARMSWSSTVSPPDFEWAVSPEAKLVVGDIGDIDLVGRSCADHAVEAVIHFAGSIVVPELVSDPLGYYENNTCKTRGLIEATVRAGVPHFIFSSTAAVWRRRGRSGAGARGCAAGAGITLRPVQADERMDAARCGGRAWPLLYRRCAISTSLAPIRRGVPGESTPGATHLIKVAAGDRARQAPVHADCPTAPTTIRQDGTCVRDYIHVSDLVCSTPAGPRTPAGAGASPDCQLRLWPRPIRFREVVESVRRVHGADFQVRPTSRRPGHAASVVANSDCARSELGWAPRLDNLDGIVSDALSWERKCW